MPIYEYECLECGTHFDRLQRFGEPDPETCPHGHRRVHRLLSQPAIIFKGSGFYVTDNRRSGGGSTSRNGRKRKESEAVAETTTEKAPPA
ncbi:MAG: zinc ribbon domain-containing protein [Anaerolineae bacterium]|nr:zinc ribbon domain-containing protein [Anaerolineae bacterium]